MNDTVSHPERVPMLGAAEVAHALRMRAHLVAAIAAAGGWLSFEHYMDLALYAPGLGYYSAGAQKLGPGGDFTTAPEISALFGACVAKQCAEVLAPLARGSILEIGAGSGRLAVDILRRLQSAERLPERYLILEVSADLRARQQASLRAGVPDLLDRVEWLDAPPAEQFDGVVLANEVLDALPVRRFRWRSTHVEELGVAFDGERLHWSAAAASAQTARECQRLFAAAGCAWDEGYTSEYCPRLGAWTRAVTRGLDRGAVLWFDYGLPRAQYYLPERHDGTLICHFRHRTELDPFRHAGLQDITAWVDFTSLAEASREAGFELAGFTTQTYFLAGLGIEQEMQALAADDARAALRLSQQARRLLMPGEMGEGFKAMAWLRGLELDLSGFRLRDLRHTL
jgi:SAM-dependent MidA family methyltransferase